MRRVLQRRHRELELAVEPSAAPTGERLVFRDRAAATAFLRSTFSSHDIGGLLRPLLRRRASFPATTADRDVWRIAAESLVKGELRIYRRQAKTGAPRLGPDEEPENEGAQGEEPSLSFHAVDGRGEGSRVFSRIEAEAEEEEIGAWIEVELEEDAVDGHIEAELEPESIVAHIESDLGLEAEAAERESEAGRGRGEADGESEGSLGLAGSRRTWIEIVLKGEDGVGVPGVRYTIKLPDGATREGTLDARGRARLDGLAPGECKVSFPDLDEAAWEDM